MVERTLGILMNALPGRNTIRWTDGPGLGPACLQKGSARKHVFFPIWGKLAGEARAT